MTNGERRFLILGLLGGAALVAALYGGLRVLRPMPEVSVSNAPHSERTAAAPPPGEQQSEKTEPGTPGVAELTAEEQKMLGVQTAQVRRRNLEQTVMAVGRVEQAETALATISARVGGRIDKLHLDFTGQSVRRGQAIAEIYSPEVVSSAEEYKLAIENLERLGTATPQAAEQARELLKASRRRLELWGLTPEQIHEIEKSDQPNIYITLYAPVSGIVTDRKVTEGQYVREGDVLYALADLSTVWVEADVYESDLPRIRMGQAAEISSDALPGQKLGGRVSFIEPMVNQQTRTVAVRVEVRNPGLKLRPGMYANVMLHVSGSQPALAVPRSAVLDTGMRKIVYVAKGDGVFEGRRIEVGPTAGDYVPVLAGLSEGERIVTQGAFMIDSQTRITGGLTGLFGGSKEFAQGKGAEGGAAWKITFRAEPDPPKGGSESTFRVSVLDPGGKPVSDAEVRADFLMPAMPAMGMGEMRASAELKWDGSGYSGRTTLPTAGTWTVTVEAKRGSQRLATYRTRVDAR